MNNAMKKLLCFVLVLCMIFSCAAVLSACGKKDDDKDDKKDCSKGHTFKDGVCTVCGAKEDEDAPLVPVVGNFTYNSWSTALGTNWNPHTWETNADDSMLGYLSSPFVSIEAKDTEEGLYQWVYEMATSITDVTADNKGDLTKYNVTLPAGKTVDDITSGYVYEIKLNPNAKWQTGEKITADDYIESMKDLLDPTMKNYRANLYYSGESAVAGGYEYYNSESPLFGSWLDAVGYFETYGVNEEGFVIVNINGVDQLLYTTFSGLVPFFGSNSMNEFADAGYASAGYFTVPTVEEFDPDNLPDYISAEEVPVLDEEGNEVLDDEGNPVTEIQYFTNVYAKYSSKENMYGVVAVTAVMLEEFKGVALNFGDNNPLAWNEFFLYVTGYGDKVTYDAVGCYKVDDYTIRYVCDAAIELNYFLTSCTSTWLVHQKTYDDNKTEKDGQIVTTYGTSLETTVSYGVYKMQTYQDMKQVIFVQNDQWYGWEKDDKGNLYSFTQFEVDGKQQQQYQTTKIVIDVMTEDVARQKFFKGELMDYSPTADELSSYATSERLYKVDETYTMSFFFNTNVEKLKGLDAEGKNKNSVVLSNDNFRKAMSLAIDRADFVTVTQGWTPAFSLMNHLYHYDIYNDPSSSYRKSDEAMQAIVNLYGVKYGEGLAYATLKEAHDAITGYQLNDAKALMKQACEELVAAGLYTKGENIKIQIGWAKGALTSDDNAQLVKINQYVNAALEGSGFGAIEFEAVGNINDRYGDTASGLYAIGYGAWGGAAFYPFRNLQLYTDPDQYDINEAGCWDPKTETLTLTWTDDDGNEVTDTLTWQEWGGALVGVGKYAGVSNDVKLAITAMLEERFLAKYYRIPLAVTTVCSILSYKVDEYTQNYNIMYGFGGFRLMKYSFTDEEWAAYVNEVGGELDYH